MVVSLPGRSQIAIRWNAWADVEWSAGQENSHYYYNQIHKDYRDARVGLSEANILLNTQIDTSFRLQVRGQLIRKYGAGLRQFNLPAANVRYAPGNQRWSVTAGRFVANFGNFSEKQHPKDRIFINFPLSYAYYVNISPKLGFVEEMGETMIPLDGEAQWGSTLVYYAAYVNGLRFDWKINPEKLEWSMALTNAAPNMLAPPLDFGNLGISSRLTLRPGYFWQQGFSLSYGTFLADSSLEGEIDSAPRQLLVGTDMQLGYGFWELSGQLIGAFYRTPQYLPDAGTFAAASQNLHSLAMDISLKYEFPFLSGVYAAYGFEWLTFGQKDESTTAYPEGKWDHPVVRHNMALGYKLNRFLLLRINYMQQRVDQHPAWAQNTWRSVLTVHF